MANTFTTVLGYMGTRVRQRLGVEGNLESLNDIFNFIQLDDRVATSGQPTEAQFGLVKEAGYSTVINLAPKSHENALGNEDEILESMGIRYIHLPVVFTNPTRDDFECFIGALESCDDDRVWVHCAANMRVSAFFFKYRTERLGWFTEQAKADLHKIWEPAKLMGVWQDFIDKA
jgi:protein tyrosine phosphatase (PTP) superfamily phosphohydrolase (DUF442 family)